VFIWFPYGVIVSTFVALVKDKIHCFVSEAKNVETKNVARMSAIAASSKAAFCIIFYGFLTELLYHIFQDL
jgi:hypothetical protein